MDGNKTVVMIGTQGAGPGEGIHAATLDGATGALRPLGLAAEIARPTWLSNDPTRPLLYAVSELGNAGDRAGEVLSFRIDGAAGALIPVSRVMAAGGGPTHLATTSDGATLFVAHFGDGRVSAMPVATDGRLATARSVVVTEGSGPHRRQQGPHPHGVTVDPTGCFLLVPDMGADAVFVYRFDRDAAMLTPHLPVCRLPPGTGPRLLVFGPDGRFAYLLTELSAEIYVFAWDSGQGALALRGHLPLDPPGDEGARSAAAIVASDNGRFLYASNRIANALHVFAIDPESGLLTEIQTIATGGAKPWCAAIAPGGRWMIVANQGADEIRVLSIDPETGRLSQTANRLAVPSPTGLAFA